MAENMLEIATRLFDALEAADVAALQNLYAPDATLWTNITQRDLSARDVAAFLPVLKRKFPDRRYSNRRVSLCDSGFFQRHRLTGTRADGARIAAECCAYVEVRDGRVVRIEEYLDSRQLDMWRL